MADTTVQICYACHEEADCINGLCQECELNQLAVEAEMESEHGDWGDRQ